MSLPRKIEIVKNGHWYDVHSWQVRPWNEDKEANYEDNEMSTSIIMQIENTVTNYHHFKLTLKRKEKKQWQTVKHVKFLSIKKLSMVSKTERHRIPLAKNFHHGSLNSLRLRLNQTLLNYEHIGNKQKTVQMYRKNQKPLWIKGLQK